MPPRKKATKVSMPSLQNCSIAFAGTTIPSESFPNDSIATVKSKISTNGGSFVTKVAECTHLCTTQAQFNKGLVKVEEAKSNSTVKIVSFDWLAAALGSGAPVDETSYLLSDSSAAVASKQSDDSQQTNGTSKKRGRNATKDEGEDSQADTKKPKTSATTAPTPAPKAPSVNVPLDDCLPHTNFKVWVGDDGTIYDATLNQSDSGANANKFYRCQLLQSTTSKTFTTWTRWGRVGEPGQNSMLGDGSFDDALKQFEKKFKDKTGNSWDNRTAAVKAKKYAFIERSYDDSDDEDDGAAPGASTNGKPGEGIKEEDADSKEVESKLSPAVQRLMRLIFNQEYFNNTFSAFDYDSKKMPLGKLSKSSLLRGYETLKELAALVNSGTNLAQVRDLSNTYLSLIPKVIPRSSRPPVLDNMNMIKKELELLEALTDMKLANDLMKGAKQAKEYAEELNLLDRQFAGLSLKEMTSLEPSSTEFKECHNYLGRTVGATHGMNYKVQNIFRIERTGEKERFDSSPYATRAGSDRRLLWHGSRVTNFGGILGQGLRIAPPEAPVSGYMFAKGIYLADMSSKSAGYCCSWNSGGTGLLLLCEAELGKPPLKLTGADSEADKKAKSQGMISTWGVGRTAPQVWKDAGCIHPDLKGVSMPDMASKDAGDTNEPGAGLLYNEYIVYDVAQVKLRYLLMVNM